MTFREYLNENMEKQEAPAVTYADLISNFAMKSGSEIYEELKTKLNGDDDLVKDKIISAAEIAAKTFVDALGAVEALPPVTDVKEYDALKDFDDGNKVEEEGPKEPKSK